MNKKVKALIGSALAIAMSATVATGATFALFTDKAEVNVSITAGKVNVDAGLDNIKLYSMDREQSGMIFENLGTADYDATNNVLTLTNITPGDKVVFDVNYSNDSNVKTKVRTAIEDLSANNELMKGLVIKVGDDENSLTEATVTGTSATSGWVEVDPTGSAVEDKFTVSIELPADRGNEYQGKTAQLRIAIEAVQWNGVTEVNTSAGLVDAIAKDSYVDVATDVALSNQVYINKDIVITGNGTTISNTGADKAVFRIDGAQATLPDELNVAFENVNFAKESGVGSRILNINNTTNDVNVVFKNCELQAGYYPINIGGTNSGNISITFENCTIEGYCALNIWSKAEVTLKNCTITGDNIYSGATNAFGVIVFNDSTANGSVVNLIDCDVYANYVDANNKEYHVCYSDGATATINATNTKFFDNGVECDMTEVLGE
jgi:predicted ribosomally synthesized peptide with SipW-like signal peptide